jgi:protein-disulfide isomerase
MESQEMNIDPWVENRIASLEAPRDWQPDAGRALAQVRQRDRIYVMRRRRWTWVAVAVAVTFLSALAVPGRCDSPGSRSCGQLLALRLWDQVFSKHVTPTPPHGSETKVAAANFKELGSPDAPVICEIYTDYQCPPCATLYRQTLPRLIDRYVRTGKVKLVYRDFPLLVHPYARLAARYANAAGRLGEYDLAVNVLFQTQSLWSSDGSIDKQLAHALPPAVMQKVRDLVHDDVTLDNTITSDIAKGTESGVHQTPTIIVVSKGKRQPIAGVPDFNLLKSYLDSELASQ